MSNLTKNNTLTPTQVYEALRQGMLSKQEDWKNMVADQATIVGPLVRTKGKKAFIEIHEAFFQTVQNQVVHQLVEHDDLVITQISTTIEATNKQVVVLHLSEWYTIRNGKIEALEVYFDPAVLRSTDRHIYDDF